MSQQLTIGNSSNGNNYNSINNNNYLNPFSDTLSPGFCTNSLDTNINMKTNTHLSNQPTNNFNHNTFSNSDASIHDYQDLDKYSHRQNFNRHYFSYPNCHYQTYYNQQRPFIQHANQQHFDQQHFDQQHFEQQYFNPQHFNQPIYNDQSLNQNICSAEQLYEQQSYQPKFNKQHFDNQHFSYRYFNQQHFNPTHFNEQSSHQQNNSHQNLNGQHINQRYFNENNNASNNFCSSYASSKSTPTTDATQPSSFCSPETNSNIENNNQFVNQNSQNINEIAHQRLSTPYFKQPTNPSTSTSVTTSSGQTVVADQQQITSTKVIKKRAILSKDKTRILENYYQNIFNFPYPDRETCESLASQCGISGSQVNKWFSNRRNKDKNTRSLTDIANRRERGGN
ncbi:hypothetical protein HELRODRAFT_172462 [Helobdella robusta]|uniref:Homeobox domain-containing protein n=1 Tax=Helobdella robusta TaxID=6412 RepID=T1F5C9_HELRO|nr:hypothetical protein HELRODRAFT_172462 [Helobdella robusta]ESO04789.1 hypothetical protein HELRODRAFT_172462 [Helobdella robusta]